MDGFTMTSVLSEGLELVVIKDKHVPTNSSPSDNTEVIVKPSIINLLKI